MKNMKKKIWLGLVITLLCAISFFSGLYINQDKADRNIISDDLAATVEEQKVLTFDEYINLFNAFQGLSIPNFILNEEISHLSNGVRAIEPSLSFDKRQFLTLGGEMNFNEDISTESTLF